jgi:hypothetical protein
LNRQDAKSAKKGKKDLVKTLSLLSAFRFSWRTWRLGGEIAFDLALNAFGF